MKFTSSQPLRAHYNPTIIQREQNLTQMIRQSFARQTIDSIFSGEYTIYGQTF